MTRSAGTSGSTLPASLPARSIADRMAARSTTAGTPVKSCSRTRAGVKGSSAPAAGSAGQRASAATSASLTLPLAAARSMPSRRTLTVIGSLSRSASERLSRRWRKLLSKPFRAARPYSPLMRKE